MLAGPAQAFAAHSISPISPILSNFASISTDSTCRKGGEQLLWILAADELLMFSLMLLSGCDLQCGDSGFDIICLCFIFLFLREWFTKFLQERAAEVPKEFL